MNAVRAVPAEETLPDVAPLKADSGVPAAETLLEVAPLNLRPDKPHSEKPEAQAKAEDSFARASGLSETGSWNVSRRPSRPRRRWYPPCRDVLDFAAALVLLILTAPIILLAMAFVRLTSRGPAIYSQTRLGRGGRSYTIYKLRSMYHDCERHTGPCWSRPGDPRVTPVGGVLRWTHLDELPQLWNVLKGDMSLIGPRPERPEIAQKLEREIPRYRHRLRVRPGITGFAQVQLPADLDIPGVRRKLAFDLRYIETMGPGLDLRILICTALKIVGVPLPMLRVLFNGPPTAEFSEIGQIAVTPLAATPEPQPA